MHKCSEQTWDGAAIGAAVQRACLLEVGAEKPGNITPRHAFHDMRYEDFVRSAALIAPVFARAGELATGDLVVAAVAATRRAVLCNTNLGIVLLLAPLATAAARSGGTLRARLGTTLAELTHADARQVYAAIRLAQPGGLGQVAEHDVAAAPNVDLRSAMASAAARDSVAREYVTDYAITFELTVPALEEALNHGLAPSDAIVRVYLQLLAEVPDTLVARKRGRADAEWLAQQARNVLDLGDIASAAGRAALHTLDSHLRDARNTWNPGTSADLIAAGLFVTLLRGDL